MVKHLKIAAVLVITCLGAACQGPQLSDPAARLRQDAFVFASHIPGENNGPVASMQQELEAAMDNDTSRLNNTSFMRQTVRFFERRENDYIALRRHNLQSYPTPPDSLPGYDSILPPPARGYLSGLYTGSQVYALQLLSAEDVLRQVIIPYNILHLSGTYLEKRDGIQVIKAYNVALNDALGWHIYAKQLDNDEWHLLLLSNMSAAGFNWNIRTNKLSDIHWWRYREPQSVKTAGLEVYNRRQEDTVSGFQQQARNFIWSSFDSALMALQTVTPAGSERADDAGIHAFITERLQQFKNAHTVQYVQIRSNSLRLLPASPENRLLEAYLPLQNNELKEQTEKMLGTTQLHALVSAQAFDAAGIIQVMARAGLGNMYNEAERHGDVYPRSYWIDECFGRQYFARQLAPDTWEITGIGVCYAYQVTWNLRTDALKDISFWRLKQLPVNG